MVDNAKANFISSVVFEGTGGVKYGVNPFANLPEPHLPERPTSPQKAQISTFPSYCAHCNLTFENLEEYEHHNVELHGYGKMFTCSICTATFKRRDHLKRHTQSLHTNQKYCNCPVCGKSCVRQDILLKHIKRKHAVGPQIYHCRECAFECPSLSELEEHEYTHLLSERILCPHCKSTFKRRDHMLRHVKSQHLNQFVVCPVCSQTYKRKDHLVRHVREKHKMGFLNGKLIKSSDIL